MRNFNNVRFPDPLDLTYIDGDKWSLNEDFRVLWSGVGEFRITVPKGYVTDLSSIPEVARGIIPVVGRHNYASVIHDYIYEPCDPSVTAKNGINLYGWTRAEADALLLEGMKAAGVPWLRRNTMWLAVRAFGSRPWNTKCKGL